MTPRLRVKSSPKRRVNPLVAKGIEQVDWKDIGMLRMFISDCGKIRARRVTGLTPRQQRQGGDRDPQRPGDGPAALPQHGEGVTGEMSRRCQLTGREPGFGKSVSHSHRRTNRRWDPNVQARRYWLACERRWVRLKLSAKGSRPSTSWVWRPRSRGCGPEGRRSDGQDEQDRP